MDVPAAPAPENAGLGEGASGKLAGVHEGGAGDHGRSVLIVVEYGDIAALFELRFDFETTRGGDVFKVDAAEAAGQKRNGADYFVYILCA